MPEVKIYRTSAIQNVVGVGIDGSRGLISLTNPIQQGLKGFNRVGSQIRVKRVTCQVTGEAVNLVSGVAEDQLWYGAMKWYLVQDLWGDNAGGPTTESFFDQTNGRTGYLDLRDVYINKNRWKVLKSGKQMFGRNTPRPMMAFTATSNRMKRETDYNDTDDNQWYSKGHIYLATSFETNGLRDDETVAFRLRFTFSVVFTDA